MGDLHRLDRGGSPPLTAASAAYLATLSGPEQRNTQRAYRSTLRALAAEFSPPGPRFEVAEFDDEDNAWPDGVVHRPVERAGRRDVQPAPGRAALRRVVLGRPGLAHHRPDQAAAAARPGT